MDINYKQYRKMHAMGFTSWLLTEFQTKHEFHNRNGISGYSRLQEAHYTFGYNFAGAFLTE